jgi:tRNA1Val (adenine37-N6)-methyltransferase
MSNSYFQFKYFTVHQGKTAMKVCTDSCLFGAWVAEKLKSEETEHILDIGTGTGLLSLMLAQKSNATVDAIEIDETASRQAQENFELSPYKERLSVANADVRNYRFEKCYDLIICNAPFYDNNLKSEDQRRNTALHSTALSFEELILTAKQALRAGGVFAVLLPFSRGGVFTSLAEKHGLFLSDEVRVKQSEKHTYFRSMLLFSTRQSDIRRSEITIKIEGTYAADFTQLLKEYYLFL